MAKPIIRWAGGKARMAPTILEMMPKQFGTLIEPFAGGAAVSLAYGKGRFVLNDVNSALVNLYRQIAHDLDAVIAHLQSWENTEEKYYEIRALDREDLTGPEDAARFLYLNKLCVKGLYRVNKKNWFNVPYDHTSDRRAVVDLPTLRAASYIFQRADITCGDFEWTMGYAAPGDVVFCDPPYVPFSKNGFVNYSSTGFDEDDHRRLASKVKELHNRGVNVILTNSNTPLVRELYADFPIREVKTRNNMNTSEIGESAYIELVVNACIGDT